ncbi:unnamed protein product [Miscanthus lutarioriparius]|uniref:CRAL-TRIO domain-containing protein n=1 Tax=Miscanthus lutarioriparius TaxID=422564 RepID=A0A811NNV4_9POAL|nr:unnamed protein product [Miscanthus lutarioriparius]
MANAGGGAVGEGEWLMVAQLRALVQAQDPRAKNYYPERLGKALMINVPYIFLKVWKTMIYPFIDANTRDKFVFVEDKSLRETLRREIDESQLPEFLGGKLPLVSLKDYAQQSQPVCE